MLSDSRALISWLVRPLPSMRRMASSRSVSSANRASLGAGLWWAAQTVTTVGYGDHVPQTVSGRLVAVLVMMVGIGLVTVITAAITSVFVARAHRIDDATSHDAVIAEQLRDLVARLERIEAALNRRS